MREYEYSSRLNDIFVKLIKEDIKVVSFDVFDTLLVRPCLMPTDIFYLVERKIGEKKGFVELRRKSEGYARRIRPYYNDDVTIDEIYRVLAEIGGYSPEEAEKIKNIEIELEKELLYPKFIIRQMFHELLEMGKTVIITSDMYLPKSVIEEILKKNGFTGYERLYLSCEEQKSKGSGRLFEKILSDFSSQGILAENIAHLGDNYSADVEIPAKMGINSFHLPKPCGILNSKKYMKPMFRFSGGRDDSFLVGILANYLFDDPYRPYNSDTISAGDRGDLGAVIFGPLLLSYTTWLLKAVEKKKIDKLLLAYRDGYIFEKIFEMIGDYFKIPKCERVYLSRSIRYKYYSKDRYGLLSAIRKYPLSENMTVLDFINNRLLITDSEKVNEIWQLFCDYGYESIYSPLGNEMRYFKLIPRLNEYFEKATADDIENISKYCRSKTDNAKNIGILDVGYQGSVAEFLMENFGIKTHSFQLFETSSLLTDNRVNNNINSFLGYSAETVSKLRILHPLIEDVISIQEGTAENIKKVDGEFVIEKSEFSGINTTQQQMQDGVLKYVKYAVEHLGKYLDLMNFDRYLYYDLLVSFLSQPHIIDARIIDELSFKDSNFIANKNNHIYDDWFKSFGYVYAQEEVLPVKTETPKVSEAGFEVQKKLEVKAEAKIEPVAVSEEKTEVVDAALEISKPHLFAIKVCEKLGIINQAIQVKKFCKDPFGKKNNAKRIEEFFSYQFDYSNEREVTLIAGAMTCFDKGTCNYLNLLSKEVDDSDFFLLSEVASIFSKDKLIFDSESVPDFIFKDVYKTGTSLKCPAKIKHHVKHTKYLNEAYCNLVKRHKDLEKEYACLCVYFMDKYIRCVTEKIKIKRAILWNEFYAYHHIMKNVMMEKKIPVCYLEFGSVPGTFSIETMGQMGKSFPGQCINEFKALRVDDAEIKQGRRIIKYLRESGINRNIQPISNEIDEVKKKLKPNRPTILYAGVNDFESGIVPYNAETKKYHSPFAHSSDEVVANLAKIAEKYDWNVIYKPHPSVFRLNNEIEAMPSNVILVKQVDINSIIDLADVVVTILSQVAYISLFREKPVLMLGYTQLRGKECTYEAFKKGEIEKKLSEAVEKGYTDLQRRKFSIHIAQMLKYNLYYDHVNAGKVYGRSITEAAEYIRRVN